MKKMRLLALVLALAMILCIPAIAAKGDVVDGKMATATIEADGTTASFNENGDMVTVTVTSDSLTAGQQYVILMVKSPDGEYTIDSDSILYIDQTAAEASGTKGTITFDVYPSAMTDGIILIAGAGGQLKLAIIKGKYVLGDADGNGTFGIGDAIAVLRVIAELDDASEINETAADVDNMPGVGIGDAIKMLRVIAQLEESL